MALSQLDNSGRCRVQPTHIKVSRWFCALPAHGADAGRRGRVDDPHSSSRSAAALLEVRKVPELGLLRQRYSEDRLYVIRMKRRSITVGVLDLVPLEAAADSQSSSDKSSGVSKPAAAQICGGGPGSGSLDF